MRSAYVLASLAGLAAAAPATLPLLGRDVKSAAQLISEVMPTANSCDGADFPDECRTAAQAAPFLIQSLPKYGVYTYAEIAAILALIGVESVDMKYKHNVSPGRPGQGTANMQQIQFNTEYATELFGADKVQGLAPNDVLALVTPDEYNFASAAWFYKNKCASIHASLQTGTDQGFSDYMGCVGVVIDENRTAYWTRAKTAFGL
ncbi:hypothetical protein GQ53DRAFT_752519 [Thozetella sp. PMI_491]|nr:hypothetical protein GQ53DRAFT_752519 [Thozetella sp. PMI_491]